jgi:hypothetical protein
MSLCADHEGEQTHCDLTVPQALELLRERGEEAVYALEDLRREVSEEPREPSPAKPRGPAPPASPASPGSKPPPSAPVAEPAPAPTSAGDQALIDSFAAALSRFEEDD